MARYKIIIRASAAKELALIPHRRTRERITGRISSLADDPKTGSGIRKLSVSDFHYRARQGVYRIIYKVDEDENVVTVTRIRHRKDAYRKNLH